jgi:hypothetical protein
LQFRESTPVAFELLARMDLSVMDLSVMDLSVQYTDAARAQTPTG